MKEYKIDLSGYEGKVREVVSEAVQKKAFELGYIWALNGKTVVFKNELYLFFNNDYSISYVDSDGIRYFELRKNTEISASDFLALAPEDVQDAPKEPVFKPFDRVLVRDDDIDEWHIDFFEGMNKDKDAPFWYRCLNYSWEHCIPYEGNEHLLGTTGEPK